MSAEIHPGVALWDWGEVGEDGVIVGSRGGGGADTVGGKDGKRGGGENKARGGGFYQEGGEKFSSIVTDVLLDIDGFVTI